MDKWYALGPAINGPYAHVFARTTYVALKGCARNRHASPKWTLCPSRRAQGDVLRGMQVVDHACGIPTLLQGETLSGIAKDMDTNSFRLPLGVTAGILP